MAVAVFVASFLEMIVKTSDFKTVRRQIKHLLFVTNLLVEIPDREQIILKEEQIVQVHF